MQLNGKALRLIREARNLDLRELATLSSLTYDRLSALEECEPGPNCPEVTKAELGKLSRALVVPSFAFFNPDFRVQKSHLIDFRKKNPTELNQLGDNWRVIDSVLSLQKYSRHLAKALGWGAAILIDSLKSSLAENPVQLAQSFANNLGISSSIRDEFQNTFSYYKFLRFKIEKCGIFVVHVSIKDRNTKGASFYDETGLAHFIVVNTYKQNSGSRIFTLLHEFCHLLLQQSGVSNSYKALNETERYCNKFAINVLAPEDEFRSLYKVYSLTRNSVDASVVRRFARHFNISQQAIAIRFEELGLSDRGFHSQWLQQFTTSEIPDEASEFGISKDRDETLNKVSRLGTRLAELIDQALRANLTSDVEVFQFTRVKPEYQRDLARATEKRISQVQDLISR